MASVWTAARTGNLQALNTLLASGHIDVNERTPTAGQTLLHVAIEAEKPQVVALLINVPGLNPNIKDNDGEAPLAIAAALGDIDSAKSLLSLHSCNVNIKNNYGKTPLHIAVDNDHEDMVQELLDDTAIHINAKDGMGRTPLADAVMNFNIEMVELLLSYTDVNPNIPTNDGTFPLEFALANIGTATNIAKQLLEFSNTDVNIQINEYGETPIFQIIENRDSDLLPFILQREDVDINVFSKQKIHGKPLTPLLLAADLHFSEAVRLLCADPRLVLEQYIVDIADEKLFTPHVINDYIIARAYSYFVVKTYTSDTKVFDFTEAAEIPFTSVPHDNLIFIYGSNYFTIPRVTIMSQIHSREHFVFECKTPSLSAPHSSLVGKKKYFNIQGLGNFLVPFISLESALTGPVNIFNLHPTGEVLPYVTSYMNILVDATSQTGLNGQVIDIASGDHCQEGTSKHVYELQPVHMIYAAAGGRRRRKTLRRKHHRKQSRKHKKSRSRV